MGKVSKALIIAGFICGVAVNFAVAQVQISRDEFYAHRERIKNEAPINAATSYAEYQRNGVAWEERHTGLTRMITGRVSTIGRDVLGLDRVVALGTPQTTRQFPLVHAVQIVYPETLPANIQRELAGYSVGQTITTMVMFRNVPEYVDAVYYDEALPGGYAIQIRERGLTLHVRVPEANVGNQIIIKDANGRPLQRSPVPSATFTMPMLSLPAGAHSIEVGELNVVISDIK